MSVSCFHPVDALGLIKTLLQGRSAHPGELQSNRHSLRWTLAVINLESHQQKIPV
ncbi:hypothetical protein SynPROS91_01428 [Synechococcus sp. PROS-9-1]|nr:hypothetical protein SynPROS91_01428 [Synechococcus sp. PROS-9-1]